MDDERISKYVERSQSLIDSSPQMDEQNTRSRLIDPFIRDVLGWDFYSTAIEMEYSVQMGSTKKKVDYALFDDSSPVVFIEAKGCDTQISESHAGQLRSYMQQEWVDWGLLTNGKEFSIFKLQKSGTRPSVDCLGRSDLVDLYKNEWIVAALSKESIRSGASTEIYERVERRRNAISVLSRDKESIAEEIREIVVDHAGDVVSQPVESLSKNLVDDLITDLETSRENGVNDLDGSADSEKIKPQSDRESVDQSGTYLVRIKTTAGPTVFADDSQTDLMAKVVDYLINEHGLIEAYEPLPYVPGKKIAMLNDSPKHPTGDEMRLFREVGGKYYQCARNSTYLHIQVRRYYILFLSSLIT